MRKERDVSEAPPPRDTGRSRISLRERYITGAVILTLLVATVAGRNAVTVFVDGRRVRTLGEEVASSSSIGRMATLAVLLSLALFATYALLRFLRQPRRPVWTLLLLEAPLVLLMVRDYATVGTVAPATIASAGLLVALWMVSPPMQVFRVLGILAVATAILSIAMGLFWPGFAMVAESAANDKALIGGRLLAGPFTHPNLLGLFLALSAPFVLLLRRWFWALAIVAAALLWTASRTALLAAGIGFAIGAVLLLFARRRQRLFGGAAVLVLLGAAVYIPVVTKDPTALTRRGEIWMFSLQHLRGEALWGLSPSWYDKIVPTEVGIFNAAAFHGHNDVITMLVRIGVVGLLLVVLAYVLAWHRATHSRSIPPLPFVVFFVVALTAGISETVWRPESDNVLFTVSVIPVALALFGTDEAVPPRTRRPSRSARRERHEPSDAGQLSNASIALSKSRASAASVKRDAEEQPASATELAVRESFRAAARTLWSPDASSGGNVNPVR
ncbi:O-antigen ligase family protein [Microbacterium esteraromaticum]|nr:O-antigen ligase family protein [Microbacterium esteraromaticum]